MRATNGRYVNRLPADTANTAAAVGKNIGAAALNAVVLVTCIKVVDLVFNAVANKHQARRTRAAANREAVAA